MTGNTYSLDVLGYEMRNGKVTFVLESNGTGADDVSFASKENTTYAKPVLSVKIDRVTNIDELINTSITIFPNPSSDGVFHIINADKTTKWKVCDLNGQTVISGDGGNIDLSNYGNGVYFIQSGNKFSKLVKE